jgi:hypothetical protein
MNSFNPAAARLLASKRESELAVEIGAGWYLWMAHPVAIRSETHALVRNHSFITLS